MLSPPPRQRTLPILENTKYTRETRRGSSREPQDGWARVKTRGVRLLTYAKNGHVEEPKYRGRRRECEVCRPEENRTLYRIAFVFSFPRHAARISPATPFDALYRIIVTRRTDAHDPLVRFSLSGTRAVGVQLAAGERGGAENVGRSFFSPRSADRFRVKNTS